jgi:hypothetical protein
MKGDMSEQESLNGLKESLAESKALLKTSPTVSSWEVELRRIIGGDRESDLLRLGSVDEYVDKILDLSKDRAVAKTCFDEALRRVIQSWQPEKPESKEYLACLLDLTGAYMPLSGSVKILYFLDRLADFGADIKSSGGYGATSDLFLKGLIVLERYFPRAPSTKADEFYDFKSYLSLLERSLDNPRYAGYATARLIDLQVIDIHSYKVRTLIQKNPKALREVLSLIFAPERELWIGKNLSMILEYSLDAGEAAYSIFDQMLQAYQGSLRFEDNDLAIHFNNQDSMPIKLDDSVVNKYINLLKRRELGVDKIHTLITEIPRQSQARTEIAEILDRCVELGEEGIEIFSCELERCGAQVIYMSGNFKLLLENGSSYPFRPTDETILKYACVELWSTDERNREELEREARKIVEEKVETAMASAASR